MTHGGVQIVMVCKHACHDHRACHRQGETVDEASQETSCSAKADCRRSSDRGGRNRLTDSAGQRDAAHGKELGEVEVQSDPEHEKDDPYFCQLLGDHVVRDEPGGVRPNDDPRDEVADQG